jgi:hypothetical protein
MVITKAGELETMDRAPFDDAEQRPEMVGARAEPNSVMLRHSAGARNNRCTNEIERCKAVNPTPPR